MPGNVHSKKQARFLGAVAGGQLKKKGLPASKAKEMLAGVKMKHLKNSAHASEPFSMSEIEEGYKCMERPNHAEKPKVVSRPMPNEGSMTGRSMEEMSPVVKTRYMHPRND